MSKKIYLAFSLAVLFLFPSVVFAQLREPTWWPAGATGWPYWILTWFFGPNIPAEFTKDAYSVLQWLIFPLVSLWVIIYGILSEIRIFRRKTWLNSLLAFLIAAISGPTGGLVYLVRILFVSYGWFGFFAFVILLFVGTGLWFASTIKVRWGLGLGTKRAMEKFQEEQKLRDQIEEIRDALVLDPGNRELTNRLKQLVDELRRRRHEL